MLKPEEKTLSLLKDGIWISDFDDFSHVRIINEIKLLVGSGELKT